ncbi:MAG TPA: hypothetical protein VFI23_01740 [Rhizomicrobium sp.]|nr:hypothetical protein [Rhizomicrobium sp.]
MPACFRADEEVPKGKKAPLDSWREPPGYLGEAVRRAKRIPSRAAAAEPLPAKPID